MNQQTKSDTKFLVNFHGLTWVKSIEVPSHINGKLNQAKTPKEIEQIIEKYETELARLFDPLNDFLVCDSAAELMADVLSAKGAECRVVCGINDLGDSHSYVLADGKRYDPTRQGYGDSLTIFDTLTPVQKKVYLTLKAYGELAVKDVVRRTGIPRNTASKALNVLFRYGVLDRRAEGKLIKYWLLNEEKRQ